MSVHARRRGEPIAVVGMSCRYPGGAADPEAFWRFLSEAQSGIQTVPETRWAVDAPQRLVGEDVDLRATRFGGFVEEIDRFDAAFFGIAPEEARLMDPQQRMLLEVTWEALERAAERPSALRGSDAGVFVGVMQTDYSHHLRAAVGIRDLDLRFITGNSHNAVPGRISYQFDLHGPSVSMDTACSSSLVALHAGVRALQHGEVDLAIVGGANAMLAPDVMTLTAKIGALSPDGCARPFDAAANGFVRGEGAGVVILKRLSDALDARQPILALVRAAVVNHDGRSFSFVAPNPEAQKRCIRSAIQEAGIASDEVDLVETHGSGTVRGDPLEFAALRATYGAARADGSRCWLGSVKTNIGHVEAGAGLAGLIKVVLSLEHEAIPPNLHFERPNPHLDFSDTCLAIPTALTPWKRTRGPRRGAVSAFGLSGTNGHVIVEEAPACRNGPPAALRSHHPFVLSGPDEEAADRMARRLLGHLDRHPGLEVADICYTAAAGRDAFAHRLATVVGSTAELHERLRQHVAGDGDGWIVGRAPGQGTVRVAIGAAEGIRPTSRASEALRRGGAPSASPGAGWAEILGALLRSWDVAGSDGGATADASPPVRITIDAAAGDEGVFDPPDALCIRPEDAVPWRTVARLLTAIWVRGVQLDWERVLGPCANGFLQLPARAFAGGRHWVSR